MTKRDAIGVAQELAPGRRIRVKQQHGYCHVVASLAEHHLIGSGPTWREAVEQLSRQITPPKVELKAAQNGKTLKWKIKTAWKNLKEALLVLRR